MKLTEKEKQLLDDFFNKSLSEEDKREFLCRGASDKDFVRKFVRRLEKETDTDTDL